VLFFFLDLFNGATRDDSCLSLDYGSPKREPFTHRANDLRQRFRKQGLLLARASN